MQHPMLWKELMAMDNQAYMSQGKRSDNIGILTLLFPFLPLSYRPALLEECEADRGRVQQRASAPLLPDPVQRGQRWSLLSPGSPLRNHQLQDLQVRAAGCAEDRRGASFQVRWLIGRVDFIKGFMLCVCVSNCVFATRSYLEMEIALTQDQISKYADKILLYSNTCMKELRRLFLVQDLVDSLKVCFRVSYRYFSP